MYHMIIYIYDNGPYMSISVTMYDNGPYDSLYM